MANHSYGISFSQLSHPSDDESSDHNSKSLVELSKGTSHIVGGATASLSIANGKKSSSSSSYCNLGGGDLSDQPQNFPAPKKPRGRPRGSKNKSKPSVVIASEDDQTLKPVIIEISAGFDVVEELIRFAQRCRVGLTVLSGSGSVTNVTLRHPSSHPPSVTLHGTFTILSLSGTYMSNQCASPSASSPIPPSDFPWPGCSSFTVCLAGTQGQIFGGVIAGNILAASQVVVVATLYKSPMLHRLPSNECNDIADDLSNDKNVSTLKVKGGTNSNVMAMPTSFNVASANPLSRIPSDVNVNTMQWGHPNHSPNY